MAMPIAAPTCWNDCVAPEPEPASCGGTLASTVWNSDEIAVPIPNPLISSGRTNCQ